jgi:exosortase F-associated protein
MQRNEILRWLIAVASLTGLAATFILQRADVAGMLFDGLAKTPAFIFNRTVRFLLNDLFALGLIYALFPYKRYIRFAIAIQLAGVIFILVPYFVLKVYHPTYNGPLINYIHRLIINPILLLLLIPAFYYQRNVRRQ